MFITDLSQYDLYKVFHGGEAGGCAIFIHHNDHVTALLLHLAHQVAGGFGFGYEANRAHDFAHGSGGPDGLGHLKHIARMNEANHVINGCFVDRNARVLFIDGEAVQRFEGFTGGNGDDVGPRGHDFADDLIAECDYGLNELAVVFLDESFFGAGVDQGFDIFGGSGRFALRFFARDIEQGMEEV